MKKSINKFLSKDLSITLLIIAAFAIISLTYFYPLLSGKQIKQSDVQKDIDITLPNSYVDPGSGASGPGAGAEFETTN